MADNTFTVRSDKTSAEFLKLAMGLYDEHKYVVWSWRVGKDAGLSQKALVHIWLRQYAAHLLKKPADTVTPGEMEGMKRSAKIQYYEETGDGWAVHKIVDPFHPDKSRTDPTSISDWKSGELYAFMEWLQRKASGDGLILEAKGEHKKLKRRTNA